MSIDIRLKHSSVASKAPLPTDLSDGELALNTNTASPAAYIKDSAGNIVQLAGAGAVGNADKLPLSGGTMTGDLVPAATGQSGYLSRAGTTLSPATAGDDVDLGTGDLSAAAGTFSGNVQIGSDVALNTNGIATFGTKVQGTDYTQAGKGIINIAKGAVGSTETVMGISDNQWNKALSIYNNGHLIVGSGDTTDNTNNWIELKETGRVETYSKPGETTAGFYALDRNSANASTIAGGLISSTFLGTQGGVKSHFYSLTAGSLVYRVRDDGVVLSNGSQLTSDARLKQNIVDANSATSEIQQLQIRNYEWVANPGKRHIGVIAQEVESVIPGAVDRTTLNAEDGSEYCTVKTEVILWKTIKALQEALTRIEALEAEVQALKGGS